MDQTATRIENKRDTKLKLHNNQQKYINGWIRIKNRIETSEKTKLEFNY